jgi:hypothetical protein
MDYGEEAFLGKEFKIIGVVVCVDKSMNLWEVTVLKFVTSIQPRSFLVLNRHSRERETTRNKNKKAKFIFNSVPPLPT